MKIGCQDNSIEDWLNFTDIKIAMMDEHALSFWKIWKPVIELITKSGASCSTN
jgi:hypothetical protein